MRLLKKLLLAAVLALPLIAEAQVKIKFDSKSSPLPIESKTSKGNALVQILLPEMELTNADLSGNVSFVSDLKKIVGGYEIWISTKDKNNSNLTITNPANPDNRITVVLTEEDNRKFLQKIFQRNPSRLMTDKKYVVRLSLVNENGSRMTPALASGELVENPNPIDNIQWEKDNQGKPMALVYLKTNGINGPIQVEEQSGLMKGEPQAYEDGVFVWVTPQKKGNTTLLIRSDKYTEAKLTASKLVGGKQYVGKISCNDNISSKAYMELAANNPCTIKIMNSNGETITKELTDTYSKVNLPYGMYSYVAKAPKSEWKDQSGTLIINGKDLSKKIELLSNTALLKITTETGNTLTFDGLPQAARSTSDQGSYYEITALEGTHTLKISRNGIEGCNEKINVQADVDQVLQKNITGKIVINKRKGSTITISQDTNPVVTNVKAPYTLENALGNYTISGEKKKYEPTVGNVYVEPLQTQKMRVTGKRIISGFSFLSYLYTPKAPYGAMLGYAKKWGGYVSLKASENFLKSTNGAVSLDEDTKAEDIAMYHAVTPSQWSKYNINTESLIEKDPMRFSGTVGVMKSITWWLYVYAGAGYGLYQTLYENPSPKVEAKAEIKLADGQKGTKTYYADQYFSTYKIEGVEAEAGIMLNFTRINFVLGWTHLFGEKPVSEPVFGIGLNF